MPELTPQELEAMPIEELKALALAAEQPVEEAQPEPVAEPKPRFRREIDLEDGSGVQAFEGATLDELLDKLTTAQKNATKKIREQNQVLKDLFPNGVPKPEVEPELKTIEQKIDYLLSKQRGQDQAANWENIAVTFTTLHPEYEATPKNGAKLLRYMKAEGIPQSLDGLERAYRELTADGLLASSSPVNEETEEVEVPARIAPTQTAPVTRRRSSSGLSVRANAPQVRTQETIEDLYDMPLDKLRDKADAALREQVRR